MEKDGDPGLFSRLSALSERLNDMLEEHTSNNLGMRYRGGIIVDDVLCIGCKKCYEVCPPDVFEFDEEKKRPIFVFSDECWYCGACILECPVEGALRMELPLACL